MANSYSVVLQQGRTRTTVNVFGVNSADAANNAKNQLNPSSPSSYSVVSVNEFNTCSPSGPIVGGPVVATRGKG